MRLATVRTGSGPRAVRVDGDGAVETGDDDVRQLLERPRWRERVLSATGPRHRLDDLDHAPVVPAPEKTICVGFNYRDHLAETGRPRPEYPELFAKFATSLVGAHDDVELPIVSTMVDHEAEQPVR